MNPAKQVPLGEVINYIRGITFRPADKVAPHLENSVVCMTTKNIQQDLDQDAVIAVPSKFVKRNEQFLQEGDMLISSANSWNLVGKVCYVPQLSYEAAAGGFISIARPNNDFVDNRYIYHWLSSNKTQFFVRHCARQTTNIANLDSSRFLNLLLPLPCVSEQKRIAAILDKADAIRRKRQETIALTDEFLRSAFLDMFGDPVTNPKGWDVKPLGKYITDIHAGWSAKSKSRLVENSEWGVLKISAVTSGSYLPEEHKAVGYPEFKKNPIVPQVGDLLFSRANTRDLVAATCLVDQLVERLFLPDKLWKIETKSKKMNKEYLRYLLSHEQFRSYLTRIATGTSGSMLNVSQAKLLGLEAPVPPITLQKRFKSIVWRTFNLRRQAESGVISAVNLFHALVQQAFRGELEADSKIRGADSGRIQAGDEHPHS